MGLDSAIPIQTQTKNMAFPKGRGDNGLAISILEIHEEQLIKDIHAEWFNESTFDLRDRLRGINGRKLEEIKRAIEVLKTWTV